MLNVNGTELGLGEIIFCFIVVAIVLKVLHEVGSHILDVLNIYTKKRMKEQKAEETLNNIISTLQDIQNANTEINEKIEEINSKIKTEMDALRTDTRHSIIQSCEEYLERGYIESYELKSLEDLYKSYVENLNGNSYAKDLMYKVRQLGIKHKYKKEDNKD